MTSYYVSGTVDGYALKPTTTTLYIGVTGYVDGPGVKASGAGTYNIINRGNIVASNNGYGLFCPRGNIYLTNGSASNTSALIEGKENYVYSGQVHNYGSIIGPSYVAPGFYYAPGLLSNKASVINGSAHDHYALIQGATGLFFDDAINVTNYGQIVGVGTTYDIHFGSFERTRVSSGIFFFGVSGGHVTNGSAADPRGLIRGAEGIYFGTGFSGAYGGFGTIANFGTIESSPRYTKGAGITFTMGGMVTNGSASDQSAIVEGSAAAIRVAGGVGTVINDGSIVIESNLANPAIVLQAGGRVTNGADDDFNALIQGSTAIDASGALTTVVNSGQIEGGGAYGDAGVYLGAGGSVTNGSTSDIGAGISCYGDGVRISGAAGTVNNSGTIFSSYLYAVSLGNGGRVTNGSTIDKTALLEGGRGVLISGAVGEVSNFGTIKADNYGFSGGYAALQLQTSGDKLVNGSTADKTALVEGYKGVTVAAGAVVINYGTITGSVSGVSLAGADAKLEAESGSAVDGSVVNSGGVVDAVSGVATITGGLTNSGVLEGAGTLALNGGTSTIIAGSKLDVAAIAVSGPSTIVQVETTIDDNEVWKQTAGQLTVASGDEIAFSGKGNSFAGTIGGAGVLEITGGTDTFNNVVLTIAKVAVISGTLTLTGSTNVAGKTEISGAVVNSGTLAVTGGELTVTGGVSGAGIVDINGGVANFGSTFTQNVYFLATTGVLELAKSQTYTGTVAGLSKTGSDSLDLLDIAYGASTKATYSGTSTAGTLTVTDGTHTAKIKLTGNFNTSTFTVSSDGHGGTKVIDPAKAPPHAFIAAMAGLGGSAAGPGSPPAESWRHEESRLAPPGVGAG